MGRADLVVRCGGAVEIALGRERIRGAGRQDEVIRADLLPGGQRHPAGIDLRRAVTHDPAAGEQPVVGKVDPRQPGRVDQGAEGGDVVHERVLRLHEHDVGDVVERLRRVDAAVASSDDYGGRPGRGKIAHRGLQVIGQRTSR
jgi:hypothetical protein